MKTPPSKYFLFLFFCLVVSAFRLTYAQEPPPSPDEKSVIHIVIKNDGSQYTGRIISRDTRELLIDTKNLGEIIIPMHEIREIREAKPSEVSATGEYIPDEVFSTRYFITTNGLPIEKGESYIQWNLYGPDIQFGVADNFGVGIMTSWFGVPIIGTAKYSFDLPRDLSAGAGLLIGTGSWAAPDFGLALPFGVLTLGNRISNINVSFGYGGAFYKESRYLPGQDRYVDQRVRDGRFLFSIAGMVKTGRRISLVFDSVIVGRGGYHDAVDYVDYIDPETGWYESHPVTTRKRRAGLVLLLPGIRLQTEPNRAFQFGFGGAYAGGELIGTPIPMVQWFRKL